MKAKANVDLACDTGSTPLFMAAQKGHVEVVKVLLQHEANVDLRGTTAKLLCKSLLNSATST